MRLPSDAKKCVVFIGLQMADKSMKIVGTGFLIVYDLSGHLTHYIVTAKHVLTNINNTVPEEVHIRVNLVNGTSQWYATNFSDWKLNSDINVDVGVYQIDADFSWDHLFYPLTTILTIDIIRDFEIGIGDEVFIIGLFVHHHGQQKNIPIARIGNISAMNEEKIQTGKHSMDGYLIEARSIGGLSGSPVFVNLGDVRFFNGAMQHTVNGRSFYLMGLIYGHYDVNSLNIDLFEVDADSGYKIERINTGLAIVTPVEKIIETIQQ